MSNYDFDNLSEGEWDDRGETAWNEFDWQQYLQQNDRDIDKFNCFHQTTNIDQVNDKFFYSNFNNMQKFMILAN